MAGEEKRWWDMLLEPPTLRIVLSGGMGGVSIQMCKIAAPFFSAASPADVKNVLFITFPTLDLVAYQLGLWLFAFIAGSLVAIWNVSKSEADAIRKAFIVGISVPALISSLGSGQTLPPSPNKPHAQLFPGSVNFAQRGSNVLPAGFDESFLFLAQAPASTGEVAISVTCSECFGGGVSLPADIIRIGEFQPDGESPTVFSMTGQTASFPVTLRNSPSTVTLKIPTADSNTNSNPYIGARGQVVEQHTFMLRAGERVTISIDVRPDGWNPVRQFFGKGPRYLIQGFNVRPAKSSS